MSDNIETLLQGIPQADHEAIVQKVQARIENAAVEELKAYHAEKNGAKQTGLVDEYKKEMYANRGQRHKLTAIREKYRQMGLNTDRVDFT